MGLFEGGWARLRIHAGYAFAAEHEAAVPQKWLKSASQCLKIDVNLPQKNEVPARPALPLFIGTFFSLQTDSRLGGD
jgi:hypothetical protein